MVPEGWKERKLFHFITKLDAGVSVNSNDIPARVGEYGILKTSSVSEWVFDPSQNKVVKNIDEIMRLKESVKSGCIIISRMNTPSLVGASAYIYNDYPHLFLPDRLWQAKPRNENTNMHWVAFVLASPKGKHDLSSLATGTSGSMKNITKSDVLSLKILTPPIAEQKKIAKILSTWDKAIETTEKLIDNAQTQKKALMQQLLTGKKRFPEFDGQKWSSVYLEDVAEIVMGSSPVSSNYNRQGIGLPLIQGNADLKNRVSAPRVFTSEITKECHVGDLLLSVRAPVGTVSKSQHHACIGRGIAAVRAKDRFSTLLLSEFLLNAEGRWKRFSQGSTFEAINSSDVKKLKFLCPENFDEQNRLGMVLAVAGEKVAILKQQLENLKEQKIALMQLLLTGKRRVKVDEGE